MKYFKLELLESDVTANQRVASDYVNEILPGSTASPEFKNFVVNFLVNIATEHNMVLGELLSDQANFLTSKITRFIRDAATKGLTDAALAAAKEVLIADIARLYEADMAEVARQEMLSAAALSETKQSQSLAHDLLTRGYVSLNDMGAVSDVGFALEPLADRHGNIHVTKQAEFLYNAGNVDPFRQKLEVLRIAAEEKNQKQTLLGVTHTGAAHFVAYEISIDPTTKKIAITIFDSMQRDALHQRTNETLLKNIKQAAQLAGYSLAATAEPVIYNPSQNNDANCAFYAARTVIRRSQQASPTIFEDILDFKLMIIKKGVEALGVIGFNIQRDELGIIYLNKDHENYKAYRATILSENAASAEVKQIFTSANLARPDGLATTLVEVESRQLSVNKKLKSLKKDAILEYDYVTEARELVSEVSQVNAYLKQLDVAQRNEFEHVDRSIQTTAIDNFAKLQELSASAVQAAKDLAPAVVARQPANNSLRAHTLFGTKFSAKDSETLAAEAKIAAKDASVKTQIQLDAQYARILQNQELIEYFKKEQEAEKKRASTHSPRKT